jgi:hypothetical protein
MTDTGDNDPIDAQLADLAGLLSRAGHVDHAGRVNAARARLGRATTVVCVVGEFKQGKSSLVNGLVGSDVCPVDDDLATSVVTVVRHAEQPGAVVRSRVAGEPRVVTIGLDEVVGYVTEARVRADDTVVDRVEIGVPSGLLAGGLALVDTPGMGGVGAGHAAATLSFLPFADGLIFVTDATRELTAHEVEFLRTARELCPSVMIAVTKTDLAPHRDQILEINRGRIAEMGLDLAMVPVSSALRAEALATRDRSLNERSGYPSLIAQLEERVLRPAAAGAAERARTEAIGMIDAVTSAAGAELAALGDATARTTLAREAADATARLERLRGSGARWNVVLGDRVSDLSNDVMHRFRSAIRDTTASVEARIETLSSAAQWDELGRELQTLVAKAVTDAFVGVEQGRLSLRAEVAALLAAEDVITPAHARTIEPIDVVGMWTSRDLDPKESLQGKAFRTGLTGMRGAQGGIMLFGISAQFLPQAGALFLASNPVLLTAGLVFGAHTLMEDRKRKIAGRRQSARTQLRQFTDAVGFEVGNQLGIRMREVQRELRDEFVDLIGELQRTWAQAAKSAEEALHRTRQQTDQRTTELRTLLDGLSGVRGVLASIGTAPLAVLEETR